MRNLNVAVLSLGIFISFNAFGAVGWRSMVTNNSPNPITITAGSNSCWDSRPKLPTDDTHHDFNLPLTIQPGQTLTFYTKEKNGSGCQAGFKGNVKYLDLLSNNSLIGRLKTHEASDLTEYGYIENADGSLILNTTYPYNVDDGSVITKSYFNSVANFVPSDIFTE